MPSTVPSPLAPARPASTVAPAVALLLLAPLCGELLSSCMPPAEWLNPIGVVLVVILYGGGALVVRETVVRTGAGWLGLLALGAAYGIVEEGLMCKSFFDPRWPDLGPLAAYGRWAGVNWVWSLGLTVYHAVFSIAVPVSLVHLMFPQRRARPWLGRRTLALVGVLLAADVVFGHLVFGADPAAGRGAYRPPAAATAACAAAVAALAVGGVWLGRRLARRRSAAGAGRRPARPVWFVLGGFGATLAFFLSFHGPANAVVAGRRLHPAGAMAAMAAVVALAGALVWHLARGGAGWTDGRRLALLAGLQGPLMVIASLTEFATDRPDDTTGMIAVGPAFLAMHLALAWRLRRRRAGGAGRAVPHGSRP